MTFIGRSFTVKLLPAASSRCILSFGTFRCMISFWCMIHCVIHSVSFLVCLFLCILSKSLLKRYLLKKLTFYDLKLYTSKFRVRSAPKIVSKQTLDFFLIIFHLFHLFPFYYLKSALLLASDVRVLVR